MCHESTNAPKHEFKTPKLSKVSSVHRRPVTLKGKGHSTFPHGVHGCTPTRSHKHLHPAGRQMCAPKEGRVQAHTHTLPRTDVLTLSFLLSLRFCFRFVLRNTAQARLCLCLHISFYCAEVVLYCYIWQPVSSSDLYKEHVVLLCYFFIVWNMLVQQDGKSSCISKVKNNRHESFRKDSKAFSHKSSLCSNT